MTPGAATGDLRVDEAGQMGEFVKGEPSDEADAVIVRYVSTGVVMSIETAKRVRDLTERQLKSFDEFQQKANTEKTKH